MPRLEHVGIAVRHADIATRLYDLLLHLIPYKVEEVERESVVTYFVDGGGTKLEFLTTDDPDSAIGRFLASNGPGLHHLAFEVDDLQEASVRAAEAGVRILGDGPVPGADGKNVLFLHPKDTHGVLIEFCRAARPLWKKVELKTTKGMIRYFTAGSAGNPVLLVVNSQFKTGLGQLVPQLESGFHVFGIESADDFRFLPQIISNETQHASDTTYLLTTQQQAPSVSEAVGKGRSHLSISASIVVCDGTANVNQFGELPELMLASTEQLVLPPAFIGLPIAVLPYPISAAETVFLDWLLLVIKGFFKNRQQEG